MRYNSVSTLGGRYKPAPAPHASYNIPASVGGINALDSVTSMAPTDALILENLVPSEYGLRLRMGYRDWATGYSDEVRTVIPFEGQQGGFVGKKLFAVTQFGIFDATTFGTTVPGAALVPFITPNIGSGYGVFTEMTNDASARFLFYADEFEGLHMYTEATDTWSTPVFAGGPSAADIAYVMVWKSRLWVVVRDTGDAYYFDPGAITGTPTLFNFGAKFAQGGELKALFNWTIDGGAGVDDMLVALGSGGNVLVYQGTDPTSVDTFSLVGEYFIGKCPASRHLGVAYGGELYLLSMYGMISVRQLLEGVLYETPSVGPSAKINRLLRDRVAQYIDSYVWRMTIFPSDGFLQVVMPYEQGSRLNAVQLVQNLITQSWGTWSGVPMICAAAWDGTYMMGTPDGRVIQYFGGQDEVNFSTPPCKIYSCDAYKLALLDNVTCLWPLDSPIGTPNVVNSINAAWFLGAFGVLGYETEMFPPIDPCATIEGAATSTTNGGRSNVGGAVFDYWTGHQGAVGFIGGVINSIGYNIFEIRFGSASRYIRLGYDGTELDVTLNSGASTVYNTGITASFVVDNNYLFTWDIDPVTGTTDLAMYKNFVLEWSVVGAFGASVPNPSSFYFGLSGNGSWRTALLWYYNGLFPPETLTTLSDAWEQNKTTYVDPDPNCGIVSTAVPIEYKVLTSFQAPGGDPTTYKRVNFIRPIQITRSPVSVNVKAVYDYDLSGEIDSPPASSSQLGSLWDSGIWDTSTWSAVAGPESFVRGTLGQGRMVAILMAGSSADRLTFVAWDIDYQAGGFL